MTRKAGRPRALTDLQIAEATKRHCTGGESVNALAKEFGVGESVLRRRIKPNGKIDDNHLISLAKEAAGIEKLKNNLAEKVGVLPVFEQKAVFDISRTLLNITESLAGAAEAGAKTSRTLLEIAHAQLEKINKEDPMDSQEHLQAISALTKMGNESSQIAVSIMGANKAKIDTAAYGDKEISQTIDPSKLSTEVLSQIMAAKSNANKR